MKYIRTTYVVVTLGLLPRLCDAKPVASPTPSPTPVAERDVVEIDTERDGVATQPQIVVERLAEALQRDHKSKKFRVMWSFSLGSGSYGGTILYNRQQRELKYFYLVSTADVGVWTMECLYRGVSENIVQTVAQELRDRPVDVMDVESQLDELLNHGCKKVNRKKWFTEYKHYK